MRNRVVWLMAALVIGFVASGPSQAQQNLLTNGGFESGVIAPYSMNGPGTAEVVMQCVGAAVPERPVEGRYCLHVVVPKAGTTSWDAFLSDNSHTFQQGKKYTFAGFFKVKSGTLQFRMKPEHSAGNYEAYGDQVFTATDKWQEFYVTTPVMTADVTPASPTIHCSFAPGDFWIDGVRLYEGDYVKPAFVKRIAAGIPSPQDKAVDVPRDVVLSWEADPYASTHNVYFGTTFVDVNTADATKPQLVSKGQTGTTFEPASPLEYGQTYYWRVDEVNAPPSTAVFKGDVWSFTVEPYAYPIAGVTATASSAQTNMGPEKTINGSGLDKSDLHGIDDTTMWLSTGAQPNWIQYQFDKVYKLFDLKVWNYNGSAESFIGFGAKKVTIEYSTDGTTWTALANVPEFAQAPGMAGYAANTTVNLGGVMAKYVRLTINSTWSGVGSVTGLSEVRFSYVPVQAWAPQPANYAPDVSVGAALDWRPGREAASHTVTIGTDKAAVANGTATSKSVTENSFTPGELEFGTMYYWKVDEVGATTYPGDLWTFITTEWGDIDNFEIYTNESPNRVFQTWIDGSGFSADDAFPTGNPGNGTGAMVGYDPALGNIMETVIVHSGTQSMPVEYNNVNPPYYSEIERTWASPQDWTVSDPNSLALWYVGYPAGFTDKGNNAFTISSSGVDISGSADEFRFVYKPLSGNGSITVKVDSLVNTNAWAKAGVMIRETLEANSQHALCVMTPGNGAAFELRDNTGVASASANTTGLTVPYWVRLTRTGNTFKGERSADGKTWTQIGADQNITMAANAYVGLCVTSHNANAYTTAEFSNVATTGTVTGQWQNLSVGVTQWSNGAAPLYVTVEDKAGTKKTVVNPDPAAVNASAWTQWQIALSDLAGVNLAAVKKLTVGVGDRANPKAGGAGKLYFDDIAIGKPFQRLPEEIFIEAESTTSLTAPLEVYTDRPDASGGKYMGSADAGLARTTAAGPGTDGSGLATYTFTVQGGIYTIRGREIVPSTSADSWWVRIKGATLNTKIHASGWIQWNNAPVNNNWAWNYIWSTDDAGKTVLFTMPAGTYTLEVAYREDGCLLDAFMITAQ